MFTDDDIERAASQLAEYRSKDALPEILDNYLALIEDFKRLKSDYEEDRDAREKYKQISKSQERNPFVVVLVDGDGYIFDDSLVHKGANGGSSAAQLLNEAIRTSLRKNGLEHCQITVRIYANAAGLSKALHKAGLAGPEKRSFAPFIASFNRSYGLTEFVDAGELKEGADFKLRALLRFYAESAQCKHIYFAACHDVGYVSDLTPYMGNGERFTLVDTPGIKFHEQFTKLGLRIEELPGVFRPTALDTGSLPSRRTDTTTPETVRMSSSANQAPGTALQGAVDKERAVCRFYQLGKCKHGKACGLLHLEGSGDPSTTWRASNNDPQMDAKSSLQDSRSGLSSVQQATTDLPEKDNLPDGHIALNKRDFRLDPHIAQSTRDTMSRLRSRIKQQQLCNSFHLNGFCEVGHRCGYDHDPLDAGFKSALESIARSRPCHNGGACRNGACTYGHICQIMDCRQRGGRVYCKLPELSHTQDLTVAKYVPAVANPPHNHQVHGESCASGSITSAMDSGEQSR